MKRILSYLLAAALAFCSCENPLLEPAQDGGSYPEGAKVEVRFTVAAEGLSPTKAQALGEDQPLQNLHLAVFGSSGYLKEYVEAFPDSEPSGTVVFEDPNDPEKKTTVPLYSFTAKLTLTDSRRIIHFIGNGPSTLSFGYADAVLSSLLSTSGERAYWQMMSIDGIHAQKDDDGDYIDANGNKITNGEGYVVADATQDQFREIPLVRNWAKLIVQADTSKPEGASEPNNPFFEPISYAVVHVPDRGTLAPHSAATNGFIQNYQTKTYLDIVGMGYPANLPPETVMDETIPSIDDFKYWDPDVQGHGDPSEVKGLGWRNGVAPAGQYGAVYLYERPVPSEQLPPTFVIVYGTYKNPDDQAHYGQKCFYKIDLMTDHKYYPVYRNFQYRILIHSILSFGHPTPRAAAAAAGSADVSADINARHLPDISDGFRRLAIQHWMAKTFTDAQPNNTELSAYFMSNVATSQPDMGHGSVTVEALPMKRGVDPVITSCSIEDPDPNVLPGNPSYGWRTIHFTTNGPSSTIRSQTLRVTGGQGEESIYRDIVITIQNIQPMLVRCSQSRIQSQKGTPVDVYIDIPDGLPESMFPLEFKIEPEAMSLTPRNDNLPVEYGPSLSESGKAAFHFIRTLDWDEYRTLPSETDASDKLWCRITCHFMSNRDNSSTRIYVRNDDYFDPASTRLSNFTDKSFWNLRFREPIKRDTPHQDLTLDFELPSDPETGWPEVELMVDGLIPEAREGLPLPPGFTQVSDVEYRFTPTGSQVTIPFYTTDASGEVYLQLSAEDYQSQSLKTHHFTLFHDVGFIDGHKLNVAKKWSNVANGKVNRDTGKTVLFGFFVDPEDPYPAISLPGLDGLTRLSPTAAQYPWTPAGSYTATSEPYYYELEFTTANDYLTIPVGFTLSAPGYLEVPVRGSRFRGYIRTYPDNWQNVKSASLNSSNVIGSPLALNNAAMGGSNRRCNITFTGEGFSADKNGVWLAAGQTGIITITNTAPGSYKFFYVQFDIGTNNSYGSKRLFPDMESAVGPGTFEKYPGNNEQCLWMLPENTENASTAVSITISANADYPTLINGIVVKAFEPAN